MAILFVDSTYDITLGLLGDDLKWLSFQKHSSKKASSILQKETWSLLTHHQLAPKDLTGIVTVAGPGFYTGLRLSEGLADVFKFFKIPHHSFYSYDIPKWCGVEEGTWMTKAYRGEYFFHRWDKSQGRNDLITVKELPEYAGKLGEVYIHSEPAIDELMTSLVPTRTSTFDLLQSESEKIFSRILKEARFEESFYFRAPEDEFKVNP